MSLLAYVSNANERSEPSAFLLTSHSRPGPHYARALEKSENAALFLWSDLPSTLIRHEIGASIENAVQTRRISKRRLCVLVWTGNSLQTELFEDDYATIIIWFPWPSFPQTQIQIMMAGKWCVFKLPRRIVLWTGSQRIFFYFNLRNNFRKHCSLNLCKHPSFILLLTCTHTECGLMLYTYCNQGGGERFAHGWSRPWCHQALTVRRYDDTCDLQANSAFKHSSAVFAVNCNADIDTCKWRISIYILLWKTKPMLGYN